MLMTGHSPMLRIITPCPRYFDRFMEGWLDVVAFAMMMSPTGFNPSNSPQSSATAETYRDKESLTIRNV